MFVVDLEVLEIVFSTVVQRVLAVAVVVSATTVAVVALVLRGNGSEFSVPMRRLAFDVSH